MKNFIKYETIERGIEKFTIDLDLLYESPKDRAIFESKWHHFYNSDLSNDKIIFKNNNYFSYYSESLIPNIVDKRPALLLLFGNPAPHSIEKKCFFYSEGKGKEHRIWRVFDQVDLLKFNYNDLSKGDVNSYRKNSLYNLSYLSPFRIGLLPFFSLATTPSSNPFTGVAGLQRLFGRQGFHALASFERERVKEQLARFMPEEGIIIAFQKDAYTYLKSDDETKKYNIKHAMQNKLQTNVWFNKKIKLIATPPTRLIYSASSKAILNEIVSQFS